MNRAITLDLWHTLMAEQDGGHHSASRYEARVEGTIRVLARYGELPERQRVEAAYTAISGIVDADHNLGMDMEYEARVAQVLELIDPQLPVRIGFAGIDDVARVVDESFGNNSPVVFEGVHGALEALKGMGLRIGLISNIGLTSEAEYRRYFERNGILHYFDRLSFSNHMATAKPNPDIFRMTLDALGIEAACAMHVGDSLLHDIVGAAAVGMATTWIERRIQSDVPAKPDYAVRHITEVPAVAERWLKTTAGV